MSQEPSYQSGNTSLIAELKTELARLPNTGSSAMAEIISRSLVHVQTSITLATPQRRAGEEKEFEIVPGVHIVMCWIPPGEILIGSPESEEGRFENEKQSRVRVTNGYWLAKTPTTQAQWEIVMGENPSNFKGSDFPVDLVSWLDICGNESRTGGFLGKVNQMIPAGERFDLPTEKQWEYACRSGTIGAYYGDLDEIAWHEKNSGGKTHSVGSKSLMPEGYTT